MLLGRTENKIRERSKFQRKIERQTKSRRKMERNQKTGNTNKGVEKVKFTVCTVGAQSITRKFVSLRVNISGHRHDREVWFFVINS